MSIVPDIDLIEFLNLKLIISMTAKLRHGEILERIVRRNRMGISELSRKLNVSRRTIYNWFGQDKLNQEIIWQIGQSIGQNLSISFPDVFVERNAEATGLAETGDKRFTDSNSVYFWMNKYIHLLEKYNSLLSVEEEEANADDQHKMPLKNRRTETFMYQ
ncbi:hypothetical protein GCM10011413_19390 [Pedobacter psychrotolerans]|uniref:HTH cro/C1-type domain-containing protein n=2 Tax=Pedobacter psychrotolerans TaxID=1843235 RepID=A0ABQ1SPG9_9SPHI|nr:hypothetical protein GCM10011413_19390 [Pedobacter psychrotolerans]